jgi:predicted ATP-dependent endonuclease of OLD family
LRTFGDGVNRLFGVILSLCNARNGVLLVDEIENGLHYSVQTEIWRTIFRLANTLNVQVFATSHSWDCVRAFQEAASESPQDGVLVRLSKVDNSESFRRYSPERNWKSSPVTRSRCADHGRETGVDGGRGR